MKDYTKTTFFLFVFFFSVKIYVTLKLERICGIFLKKKHPIFIDNHRLG